MIRTVDKVLNSLSPVLVIFGMGLVGVGLIMTGIRPTIWTPEGWRRFLTFVAVAGPTAGALLLAFRGRWPLGFLLASAAILIAFLGIGPVAAVLYVTLSCLCMGRLVLGRDWGAEWQPLTAAVLQALVGFALLSGFLNVAMHFKVNTSTSYALGFALPLLLARDYLQTLWSDWKGRLLSRHQVWSTEIFAASLLLLVLAIHLVYVALPERYWDALAMHLWICTTVFHDTRWSFDCANFVCAVQPMNGDWFFAIGYLLGGESGARLVNYVFFLMILALLYGEISSRSSSAVALFFVALFASTPIAFIETASLFIENVLTAFLLGSFVVLARRFHGLGGREALGLALLLGAAASTKLHGLIFLAVVTPIAVFACFRRDGLRAVRTLGIACAVSLFFAAPPYLYAYWVTGNPVFPYYNGVFQSPLFPANNFVGLDWGKVSWRLLYDLTFRSHEYVQGWDGAFGFHFLALGLAGVVIGFLRRDRLIILATLVSVAYLLATSKYFVYLRYLYPVFPIFLLACTGVCCHRAVGLVVRGLVCGAALLLLVLNLYFLPTAGWILPSFDTQALFSKTQRTILLEQMVPTRQLVQVVNALAGPKANVLFIADQYSTDLQGKSRLLSWYNWYFCDRFQKITEPGALLDLIRREGITHAIVSMDYPAANRVALDAVLANEASPILTIQRVTLFSFLPTRSNLSAKHTTKGGQIDSPVTRELKAHDPRRLSYYEHVRPSIAGSPLTARSS